MPVSPVTRIVLADDRHRFQQLKQLAHRGAAADDAFEPVSLLKLRPQVRVFRFQPRCSSAEFKRVQQLVELKRLGDEIGCAALDGFHGVFHRSVTSDDDADDVGIAQQRGFEDARAVEARQAQVGDDDVEGKFGELLDRALAGVGLFDFEPVLGQALGECLAQRRLVLNQEEMFRGFRHLRERQDFDTIGMNFKDESQIGDGGANTVTMEASTLQSCKCMFR